METREFDIFSDMLANKDNADFTVDSLSKIGMRASNTSLQDRDVYKNNEWVQELFKGNDGKFDENAFNNFYTNAKLIYNQLAIAEQKGLFDTPVNWHRDNIFVDPSKTNNRPEFLDIKISNPYLLQSGLIELGRTEDRTKSEEELALGSKVLLNPLEAEKDPSKAKWGKDPHSGIFKYLDDTLVLAQYELDGDYKNPVTGELEHHVKGDLKLDDTGNFYYEKLDGRNPNGKRVLNKFNILTEEGSWANKYDFFDSDDLHLKSAFGTIMKNAMLVGTMFIPGVGPWVAGLSVASLLAGLAGTIGKMATLDSNNAFFNELEGWSKSVSRQAASEYSLQHPFSLENMINMIGDSAAQLRELRFIFKTLPEVFSGTKIMEESGQVAKRKEFLDAISKFDQQRINSLLRTITNSEDLLKAAQKLKATEMIRAELQLTAYIEKYLKIGELMSKGYMTAITVADTFAEAKEAGASDIEAVMLTLGHAAGEWKILNSDLGEIILPELRANRKRYLKIAEKLGLLRIGDNGIEEIEKAAIKSGNLAKQSYLRRIFNLGKSITSAEYANGGIRAGGDVLKSVGAASLGEAFEEVSEEALADFSKACYDVYSYLTGDNSRINPLGYDYEKGEFDYKGIATRYGMNALGGFFGGGIANAFSDYKQLRNYNNLTSQLALQEVIYMARNKELDKFKKAVSKMEIGNKNLSTDYETSADGAILWNPGTKENNLDLFAKRALFQQLDQIQNILDVSGANISDDEFIDALTFKDLRFEALRRSTMAGAYLSDFNTLSAKVVKLSNDINLIIDSNTDSNGDGILTDPEKRKTTLTPEQLADIKKKEKLLKEAQKELKDLVEGKHAYEFISDALFEMTPSLSSIFKIPTFTSFVELKTGKKFSDVAEKTLESLREEFETFKTGNLRDRIKWTSAMYRALAENSSKVIKEHADKYLREAKEIKKVEDFISKWNTVLEEDSEKFLERAESVASDPIFTANATEELLKIFGSEDDIQTLRSLYESAVLDAEDPEERKKLADEFSKKVSDFVIDTILKNLPSYLEKFLENGFINTETKDRLVSILDVFADRHRKVSSAIMSYLEIVDEAGPAFVRTDEDIKNLSKGLGLSVEEISEMSDDELFDMGDESARIANSFTVAKNKISALTQTPFEKNLNDFAISVGNEPINITLLIEKLNQRLRNNLNDITNFKLDADLPNELANAIQTILMYKAAILGARTDDTSINNLFGYNATLNEIAKKMDGKKPELAEIDSRTASILVHDLEANLSKLLFLLDLYLANTGRKLAQQEKVSLNKELLIYKKIKEIINVRDDDELKSWDGFDLLLNLVNSLAGGALDSINPEDLKATPELKEKIQQEVILLEDAFFTFLNDNIKDWKNPDIKKLRQLIDPTRFNLYTEGAEIINENSTAIDDNAFLWWMASRAALKSTDFHHMYKEVINPDAENPIAPIAIQELPIYNDVAHIVNPYVYKAFLKAWKESMMDDWKNKKSLDAKKDILTALKIPTKYAEDKYNDFIINTLPVPRYTNIVLTEGIPGAGKTNATFYVFKAIMDKFYPNIMQNVWIGHGVSADSATKLGSGLEITGGKTLSRELLLELISKDYEIPSYNEKTGIYNIDDSHYVKDSDGLFVAALAVNETPDVPSVIIIDEISQFTLFELDLIEKFAEKYGISVLVAGDFDQSGVSGSIKFNHDGERILYSLISERYMFPRTPKLGVSMRTDNELKSINLTLFLEFLQNPNAEKFKKHLQLLYYLDNTGIYGDKVYQYAVVNNKPVMSPILDLIKADIELLKATSKNGEQIQKIGYIYNDTDSELYKELSKPEYDDFIDRREGNSAQGDEAKYFIIDINPLKSNEKDFLKDLYTGISRSKQGSLVIVPVDFNGLQFIPVKETSLLKEALPKADIKRAATTRKKVLDKVVTGGNAPELVVRDVKKDDLVEDSKEDTKTPELGIAISGGHATPKEIVIEVDTIDPSITDPSEQRKEALELLKENPINVGDVITIETKDPYDVNNTLTWKIENITDSDFTVNGNIYPIDILLTEFGYTYTDNNGVEYKVVDNSGRHLQWDPSKALPYYGDSIIILETNGSEQTYKDKIDKTNEDKNLNNVVEVVGDTFKIKMLLYSFNTFEKGVFVDKNGYPIIPGGTEWEGHRFDSIQGLMRIKGFENHKVDWYLDKIAQLREYLFTIKDKGKLQDQISRFLKIDGLSVTFAYKSTARLSLDKVDEGQETFSEDPNPYEKFDSEETEENGSIAPGSKHFHNKTLVAEIHDNKGKILLELPLLAFTSPITLLKMTTTDSEGKLTYVFGEIAEDYKELRKTLQIPLALGKIVEKYSNDARYTDLINLIKLFDITNNTIFVVKDTSWTIAKNLTNLGPQVVGHRGKFLENESMRFDWNEGDLADLNNWTTIQKLADLHSCHVSQNILMSQSGMVQLGGRTPIKAVNAGHPFVLYTNMTHKMSDDLMAELWIKQQYDPNEPKLVKLLYIIPPKATFKDYVAEIKKIMQQSSEPMKHVGNLFTSYRLMQAILKSPVLSDMLNSVYPNMVDRLKDKIANLEDLESTDMNAVKDALETGVKIKGYHSKQLNSLASIFNGIIYNMSIKQVHDSTSSEDDALIDVIDDEKIKIIEEELAKLDITGIFRNFRLISTNRTTVGKNFLVPEQEPGYKIDGLEARIHGKIDSFTFQGDMGALIESFLELLIPNDSMLSAEFSKNYIKGYITKKGTKNTAEPNTDKPNPNAALIDKYKNIFGEDITSELEGKSPLLVLNYIVSKINEMPSKVAIGFGLDFLVGDLPLGKSTIKDLDGKPILNIKQLIPNVENKRAFLITFKTEFGEETYQCSYKEGLLTLESKVVPKTEKLQNNDQQRLNLFGTQELWLAIKQDLTELEDGGSLIPALVDFINVDTYEEFVANLSGYSGSWDEDTNAVIELLNEEESEGAGILGEAKYEALKNLLTSLEQTYKEDSKDDEDSCMTMLPIKLK